MFRPSPSARLVRQSLRSTRASYKSSPPSRRYLTTEPPHKLSRSWKNSATRWALALGGVYWYNTTPVFAEQPRYTVQNQEAPLPTLESLSRASRFAPPSEEDLPVLPVQPASSSPPSLDPKSPLPEPLDTSAQSPEELESEAASQGAFNEETGEINWDCPCLGGMAHGPCGPEFREAFSCFVFSKEEPKGMDCVEKFKGMQTCFRAHPEEYGDQLDEDEDEAIERDLAAQGAMDDGEDVAGAVTGDIGGDTSNALKGDNQSQERKSSATESSGTAKKRSIYDSEPESKTIDKERDSKTSSSSKKPPTSSSKLNQDAAEDDGGVLVPKAAHDAT